MTGANKAITNRSAASAPGDIAYAPDQYRVVPKILTVVKRNNMSISNRFEVINDFLLQWENWHHSETPCHVTRRSGVNFDPIFEFLV